MIGNGLMYYFDFVGYAAVFIGSTGLLLLLIEDVRAYNNARLKKE